MTTIMYPERMYPDDSEERRIFGPDVSILMRDSRVIADLSDAECAEVDGLMIFRQWVGAADMARFPRLRAIVRMGVGYDRLDRAEAARRGVIICNVPDYGTTEVADHAIALTMALRRGLLWHHDAQRADPPAPWVATNFPLLRRISAQTFGVLGLGRIGTAAALRAKGLGFKVVFYDPYRPNGADLALGIGRAATPAGPAAPIGRPQHPRPAHAGDDRDDRRRRARASPAGRCRREHRPRHQPRHRRPGEALRSGRISGAGLDVVPVEPPVDPVPDLLRAYRAREYWLEGRLIVTPHSAYLTPEAHRDIRIKSAETMRAALFTNRPQNVITPEMYCNTAR